MKNLILSLVLILLSVRTFCTSPEYHESMITNLKTIDTTQTADGLLSIAASFERISMVEQSEWLPLYYAAFTNIIATFRIQDAAKRDQLLVLSDTLIEKAMRLKKDESELYALKGFYYLAYISIDPMNRGMQFFQDVNSTLEQAKAMNQNNPRAYYLQGLFILNTPAGFGGGKEAALPILKQAKEKFDADNHENDLLPNWGKQDCERIMAQ